VATAVQASPSRRVVFIDLARAVAVVMMVQGHAIDTLLAPPYRSGPGYDGWLFMRGLTSCMFLTLSGLAFTVTALHHWDDQRRLSRRLARRVFRLGFFLALAYLLRFPMAKFAHLPYATDERWQSFFVVDILQVVAVVLLLLQALIGLLPSPRALGVTTLLLGAAVVVAGPLAWAIDWTALPLSLASYLSPAWGSLFPVFPWAGYILLGAAFGVVTERWLAHDRLDHVARVMITTGLVIIAAVWMFRLMFIAPYGSIDIRVSPGFFLLRLGGVAVVLGAITQISMGWRGLPAVVQAMAEQSLLVYAVHVALLYGSRWNTGLREIVGPSGPGAVLAWVALLVAGAAALAWAWGEVQRRRPGLASAVRVATITALVYPLLGW
jgi:uncharacterized membrane protein